VMCSQRQRSEARRRPVVDNAVNPVTDGYQTISARVLRDGPETSFSTSMVSSSTEMVERSPVHVASRAI
jgi:hypothetical protein